MGLFSALDTSASGLTAERLRMDLVAANLANANTTRTAGGGPYQRRVALTAERVPAFPSLLTALGVPQDPVEALAPGVRVAAIARDPSPFKLKYDPTHPDADPNGYVRMPNVDPVTEMVDLITASRAYEANATAISAFKAMVHRALEIGR